jgi:hypothetical protein
MCLPCRRLDQLVIKPDAFDLGSSQGGSMLPEAILLTFLQ